nr:hypothetical protein [Tanacetum cinerariifolium]
APPSPDYIPGPEEPEQAPPLADYITCPEHVDDEIVAEEQPYTEDASPITQSPEYVLESDFEAHPEDDDDEDPEEDPVDYLADGGDDGDDKEDSSEEDEDDEMDIEADEEEEEHPAPTDSVVVAPTATDQAPSAEETEPFETDESAATPPPHPAYRMTVRISIPALVPMPAWTDSEVVRILAISSPPASPLSPWSLPPPQIPFPLLPSILSPPSPVLSLAPPPSPIRSLGYRAAMIRLRDEAASASSPPLKLPSSSRREDRPEGAPVSTDTELGGYVREFETRVRQDTDEIYMRLDDEQTERHLLAGRLNMLFRDRLLTTWLACHPSLVSCLPSLGESLPAVSDAYDAALTWWNSQIRSLGPDAYSMTWEVLKKKMTDKANPRNNHGHQQQPAKRQNVAKAYNMGSGEKNHMGETFPNTPSAIFIIMARCTQKCHKCNKIGHFARDCRSSSNTDVVNAQRDNRAIPKGNAVLNVEPHGISRETV